MGRRFENKVAVITGGARGIGRATALLMAEEGAKVVVADLGGMVSGGGRDASVAEGLANLIRAAGGEAIAITADVAAFEGAGLVVNAAIEAFGRLDILVNSAGILRHGKVDEASEEAWDEIMRVNLKSAFAMVRHAAPHMKRQRNGTIICLGSPSGYGHYGMSAYATSKEGLIAFTRSIAQELGEHGIRCNALRPCAETRMAIPEVYEDWKYVTGELGLPAVGDIWLPGTNGEEPSCLTENVAATIAWLCLPETEALNGRTFYVSGGHLAICAEPELIRSRYQGQGWDLDALLTHSVLSHFTYGQSNHFPQRGDGCPSKR